MTHKQRLKEWVDANPSGWLIHSFAEIAEQAQVAKGSVYHYLPTLIADRDGILASEVMAKRKEAGLASSERIDKVKIYEMHDEGVLPRDIAQKLKCNPSTVYRALRDREHLERKAR